MILNKMIFITLVMFLPLMLINTASAHSGRTDSSGGHNCNVGSCAGTYHYHNGGGSNTPPPKQPVITTKTIYETEAVPFQTTQQNDSNLEKGTSRISQDGNNGIKTHTYKVTFTDGVQTGKTLVSSSMTTQPVEKIITIGIKEFPIASTDSPSTPAVAGISKSSQLEDEETASAGETAGGFAILGGLGYGVFRFGRYGYTKIKRR